MGSETYNLVKDFISQTYNNQTFEQVLNSPIQYHQPLFLFESFFNFW
ncbi:Uncharacterised protein, partial [Mycoplasma putrefaciens]